MMINYRTLKSDMETRQCVLDTPTSHGYLVIDLQAFTEFVSFFYMSAITLDFLISVAES